MSLNFRIITPNDYQTMFRWLGNEHVREWWDDSDDTLEKVADHYGSDDETARYILIESEGVTEKPLGYFQYYFASDAVIGIDQFIGEADCINRGIGAKAVRLFVKMIERKHHPAGIILDPSPDNKRAIRCYEKAGFVHYETGNNENGHLAYMMRINCNHQTTSTSKPIF